LKTASSSMRLIIGDQMVTCQEKGLDVELRACGDGSDQAGRSGRAQGIAVPTFKPDPGEMRRV
jgi:hypothetical protein